MRRFILLIGLLACPAVAGADLGLTLGASLNTFEPEAQSAYGAKLRTITENLEGDLHPAQTAPNFAAYVGFRPMKTLEVQARYRQWTDGVVANFGPARALNFSYRRDVRSVAALGRLLLGDGLVRLHVGGGPVVYVVDTTTTGWLGEQVVTHRAVGAMMDVAIAVRIPDTGEIEFGLTSEQFSLPHSDLFVDDGGQAGGYQAYAGLSLYL